MDQHRDGKAAMGGAADFLGQHDRGAGIEAGAAQRFGDAQREEAELAHLAQHLARHEAGLLPFRPLGLHALVDEAAQLGADQVVLFGEDGMCHGGGMLHSADVTRQTTAGSFDLPALVRRHTACHPG